MTLVQAAGSQTRIIGGQDNHSGPGPEVMAADTLEGDRACDANFAEPQETEEWAAAARECVRRSRKSAVAVAVVVAADSSRARIFSA